MATTKKDHRAEKERKQKIILAVGGVLLLGVVALQGPKLLNHFKSSSSAAPATTPAASTPGVVATGGASTSTPTTPIGTATKYSAQLAGIVITPASPPSAGAGQLWSFSRFKVKDPFVQQVNPNGGSSSTTTSSSGAATTKASKGGAGNTLPSTTGAGSPQGVPTGPPTNATLLVNGHPQRLVVHQLFPKGEPMFVLVKLTSDTARIGVAGGSFTAGNTLLLEKGKPVTLMNTTTGQRYVVKLVYTGFVPEDIAGFKAPAQPSSSGSTAGTTQPPNQTTTPATTSPTTTTSNP
jgi:hypothetical protein